MDSPPFVCDGGAAAAAPGVVKERRRARGHAVVAAWRSLLETEAGGTLLVAAARTTKSSLKSSKRSGQSVADTAHVYDPAPGPACGEAPTQAAGVTVEGAGGPGSAIGPDEAHQLVL